jgi:PhnB protein
MSTFKEYNASQDPSEDNKVMHAMLEADNGITFMASDTPNRMEYKAGTNYSMSLSGDNEAELKGYFERLYLPTGPLSAIRQKRYYVPYN